MRIDWQGEDDAAIQDFWLDKLEIKDDQKTARIDGVHYRVGPENAPYGEWFRGFSGRKFIIKFHDGRKVVTTNLWCQGHIPMKMREQLPDNAEFIKE